MTTLEYHNEAENSHKFWQIGYLDGSKLGFDDDTETRVFVNYGRLPVKGFKGNLGYRTLTKHFTGSQHRANAHGNTNARIREKMLKGYQSSTKGLGMASPQKCQTCWPD